MRLLTVVIAAAFLVTYGGSLQAKEAIERPIDGQMRSEELPPHLPILVLEDREAKARDDRAEGRAEQNLILATYSLWVAIGGSVLSLIGTLLVVRTYILTNRTFEWTRRAGMDQLRAYIGIEEPAIDAGGALSFLVKNYGGTPAS
ncbi:hypothetical protein RPE78_17485 (plasmid) [Thioclava litoralis]|uniref:MotA/TolQ/ExbB proton channel family protein n=1 Tax=Thioclava litoralis TaxID=3076557 RepID=A0ABZ1E727_9RHOB|nr:hypothetical protein RPE78_17485 [Thioclava sp. FTW29]